MYIKGCGHMLRQSIQRIKAMDCVLCMLCLFVNTVNTKIKHAMYWMLCLSTLSTLVFVAFTQHYIQSNIYTVDAKLIHTFLPITFLIFNWFSIRNKGLESWDWGLFNLTTNIYVNTVNTRQGSLMHSMLSMSTLSIQGVSISNAFNAIYVNTVDTKHESV